MAIARSEPQLVDAFTYVFRALSRVDDLTETATIQARLEDILSSCISASIGGFGLPPPQVREIETYMLSDLDRVPSLGQLSSMVGWSQYHLAHVFSKYIGLSPVAFHTRARLMRARTLISTGWTLSETSAHLNFSDQSHFGRHFRRVYDMTPGEYQQSIAAS